MAVTAAQVKELREKTGAGIMDAKRALVETDGNMEAAAELLREKGIAKAAKKADRVAAEGLTGIAVNGNVAALVELNSETDFVAKNDQFVALVKETAELLAASKPANNEEALAIKTASGVTLEQELVQATATIGEKITFRRFVVIEKTDAQHFGAYQHNGGKIGVISVIEGADETLAKQVSMHIAAMNPTVLSADELDSEFVKAELAQMNHKIDEDNASRVLVNKPELPHHEYGSKSQLTEEVLAAAKASFEEELKAEGKPEKIWDKILQVKWLNLSLTTQKLTNNSLFLHNFTSWMIVKLLKLSLNLKVLKQLHSHVLKLVKELKKLKQTSQLKLKQQKQDFNLIKGATKLVVAFF